MKKWYYAQNGTRQGPVDADTVKKLFESGEIKPDDLVWEEGMPDWVKASTILSSSPPPIPVVAPTGQPPLIRGTLVLPDYGDFLCWGVALFWIPVVNNCIWFVFVVLHILELTAVRRAVADGLVEPTEYSKLHPVFLALGLLFCGLIAHPITMRMRNRSKLFKQQPHAVWFFFVNILLCTGAIIGLQVLGKLLEQSGAGR